MNRETAFFNIDRSLEQADVDAINKDFYGRINYPWAPLILPRFADGAFWPDVINGDLGHADAPRLRPDMKIWVAGCGTNQAALTALRFPDAQVVGSDISTTSLATCRRLADDAGIGNLELREESLNQIDYRDEFDLILCTGVVHHNADPAIALRKVAAALKPDGVMELMVYNYYHRILTTAYQKAIRLLGGSGSAPDIDVELPITTSLIRDFPVDNHLAEFLKTQRNAPDAAIADYLLQPVEYSYTIETFDELCRDAGLDILTYCVNQFDNMLGHINWRMKVDDAVVAEAFDRLGDKERWQVVNLLLGEKSPLLWFYVQRVDCGIERMSEAQLAEQFLETIYVPRSTMVLNYILDGDTYRPSPQEIAFPAPAALADPVAREVLENVDGYRPMKIILKALKIDPTPYEVARLRSLLATSGNPYLRPKP